MTKPLSTLKKLFNLSGSVYRVRIPQLRGVRIGPRLAAGFLSIALIVLLGNAFTLWQFYKVRAEVDRLFAGDQELIAVLRFQIDLRSFYTKLNELIESKDKDHLIAESEELHKALLNDAQRTKTLFKDVPPGSKLGSEVEVAVTAVQSSLPDHLAAVRSLARSGDWEVLQLRVIRQMRPLELISADLVNEVDADIATERAQAVTSITRAQNRMLLIFILTAIFTLIIAGIVGAAITGSITEPLRRLEDASGVLALGDFQFTVQTSGNDELSHLGRVFNDTLEKLETLATERKLAEEAVRRSEANLAEAQRLTHTGSFVWDANTRKAVHLSDEWYRLYELDLSQGVPSFDERPQRIHPDDRTRWQAAIEQAIREKSDYELDTRLLLPSGITRHLHTIGHAVLDASGDVVEFIGTATDITERKQAEEALRRSEDHLRETRVKLARASRIATVAELSASIAHELNQPLTSVVANAQAALRWLLSNPPNIPETMTSIERVLRDGRTADERMQHIRALFKRESFEKKETSMPALFSEAIRLVREDSKKAAVPIGLQVDDDLPTVLVDPIQIQEVIMNLMSNGIEAMENNLRPPYLTIRADLVDEREILIEVIDNGPGLEDTENIFDAFITTKESGMGIGLAVSRSIVEAHDGQLWAENNPDYGAKFIVRLPSAGMRMGR
jgi:signal transduction histidine kinase/HAMP domain-containing protein